MVISSVAACLPMRWTPPIQGHDSPRASRTSWRWPAPGPPGAPASSRGTAEGAASGLHWRTRVDVIRPQPEKQHDLTGPSF